MWVWPVLEEKFMKTVNSVQSQLCLTAAALAGTAMGFEQSANAAVVTTFASANISVPATTAGVYINLQTGATASSAGALPGWDFNPYLTGSGLGFYWNQSPAGTHGGVATAPASTTYANLAFGTVVGPSSPFTAAIQGTAGTSYRQTGISYLGFRFRNAANVTNYGYAAIQTSATNGFPATVLGWIYEDSGASITVQQIPTPGAAGVLGMLAAGAMTRRRKA
jgi:hypothetical protein